MRILLLLGIAASGCSSNMMSDDDTPVNCATETRAEPFVAGTDMIGAGGALAVKVISATPATPQRNDNSWVVELDSMSNNVVGAPLAGADIEVSPYMPDHQHGNGIPVTVTASATAGQYTFDPLFLGMPGYWEITVSASVGSVSDMVVYKVCVPN
jgi:hypothetical protein